MNQTSSQASTHDVDQVLMVSLQGGDRKALASLYERHCGYLLAIGLKILKEREEAEDVVHAVFVEVWQKCGSYRPDRASVRTWLALRMRSRCLDRVRSADYSRTDTLDSTYEPPSVYAPDRVPRMLDAKRAAALLSNLPDDQKRVVELRFFRGLSSTEIAQEVGVSSGTVKSRMRLALAKLRDAMEVTS